MSTLLHLVKKRVGFEDVIDFHDQIKDVGAFSGVLEILILQVTAKDRAKRHQDIQAAWDLDGRGLGSIVLFCHCFRSVQHATMNSPSAQLEVLAFEGFDGGSHLQVRKSLSSHSRHEWNWVARPARAWKWRMRTGAMELIEKAAQLGLFDRRPDVIFVTSMISVGDLRALLPMSFRTCPVVLYMHENQAAYPYRSSDEHEKDRDHQFALTNLTSIAAADRVLWNSRWNLDSFCLAIEDLLDKSPDRTLEDVGGWIQKKSEICWPPIDRPEGVLHNSPKADNEGRRHSGDETVTVLWPHRWEHDKGPETLLRLARYLKHRAPGRYRWILLGERYRRIPDSLTRFLEEFRDDIDHAGWVESKADYWQLLSRCDWVLSTARHEFFGVAVVEAMIAGCLPWLPSRLSYPEIIPEEAKGLSPANASQVDELVRQCIERHLGATEPTHAAARIDAQLESVVKLFGPDSPPNPDRR